MLLALLPIFRNKRMNDVGLRNVLKLKVKPGDPRGIAPCWARPKGCLNVFVSRKSGDRW